MITQIFILQSLKSSDLSSGEILSQRIAGTITCSFAKVYSRADLFRQLDAIETAILGQPGQYIIHFDCHWQRRGCRNLYCIGYVELYSLE